MYWSLAVNILLMYAILFIVNLPAPFFGITFETDGNGRRPWFEPPGYVVPVVWFVLFTLMGIARFLIASQYDNIFLKLLIISLATLCALYAYNTISLEQITGISQLWFGLVGNIVVIIAAAVVCWLLYQQSKTVSYLILPVVVWTVFATCIIVGQLRLKGMI